MNLSNRPALSRRNKVLATLLFAALAVVGNYLSLPLFFGVDFIFGSVAVMLALLLLGVVPALIVALVGGLYTLELWGHPYALIVFSIEALVVSLLYRRGMRNLVLADILYWLLLGMPMVLLFYIGILAMDIDSAILVALKQGLNAWFNTLLAGALLTFGQIILKERFVLLAKVDLATLLFQSFLLVTLLAGAAPIIHESYSQQFEQEFFVKQRLEERASELTQRLQTDYTRGEQRLDYHLRRVQNQSDLTLAILSQDGTVIAHRGDSDSLFAEGHIEQRNQRLQIWLPAGDMSAMQRWKTGVYRLSQPVDAGPRIAQVHVLMPARQAVITLEKQRLELFVMLAVIFLLAFILAYWLSQVISQPLRQLESISKGMANRVMGTGQSSLPTMQIQEYANLADSLETMNTELGNNFMQLQQVGIRLELEVQQRTQDLTSRTSELQAVLTAASEFAIIATDLKGMITLFNKGARLMLGYSADEVVGLQSLALFHVAEEVAARSAELSQELGYPICGFRVFVEVAERDGSETREWTYVREDGQNITVSLTITPQSDEQGTITGFLGIAEDITERKLDEQALEQFKSTLDQTLDCVFMFDADELHFFYANEGAIKQVGYSLNELLAMQPFDIKPEIGEVQFRELIAPLLSGEQKALTFETIHLHKHGQRIPVEIFLQYIAPVNEAARFVAIVRDITERKQIETELAEQAQHTQAILDTIEDGIITIDSKGIMQTINPAVVGIFGYATADLLGKNVSMLMPDPHAQLHDSYLRNYKATGIALIIGVGREVQGRRQDGSLFDMELQVAEIIRDGRPNYVGMVRDISERKQMERMKSEFVSTVSHELRTPLTAVCGALDLVASGKLGTLNAATENLIVLARNNSQRLKFLINDLLDLEKLTQGKLEFDIQPQPLRPLLLQAIESHQTYSLEQHIRVELAACSADVMVQVDAQRLAQVLANLLSNAIKFSPAQSLVKLTVQTTADSVRVTVTDQGAGIPEAFKDKMFERFCQADSSDTRKVGGTGLGLAICRELIERMNGSIGFESVEGQGAAFWFELPRV